MVVVDRLQTTTDQPHHLLHTGRIRRNQVCQRDTDRKTMQVLRDLGIRTMPGNKLHPKSSELKLTSHSPWQRGAGYEH